METHFNYIPKELTNIILSYLEYEDLIDLNEIEGIPNINYEKLFSIRFPEDYRGFKLVLNKDFPKYRKMWNLFYAEFESMNLNSITSNIKYSSFLLMDYPRFYVYIDRFIKLVNYNAINNVIPFFIWEVANEIKYYEKDANIEDSIEKIIIQKFINKSMLSVEEYEEFDLESSTESPELLGLMMLEDCFIPDKYVKSLLRNIKSYIHQLNKENIYYIIIYKL